NRIAAGPQQQVLRRLHRDGAGPSRPFAVAPEGDLARQRVEVKAPCLLAEQVVLRRNNRLRQGGGNALVGDPVVMQAVALQQPQQHQRCDRRGDKAKQQDQAGGTEQQQQNAPPDDTSCPGHRRQSRPNRAEGEAHGTATGSLHPGCLVRPAPQNRSVARHAPIESTVRRVGAPREATLSASAPPICQGGTASYSGINRQLGRKPRAPGPRFGRLVMSEIVTVSGVALEIEERGSGRPLLFLHPGEGLQPERPWLDLLAKSFRVIAPHHPGFGGSALPDWIGTVDDLAYLYLDLAARMQLNDAVLAGACFGGWIAAEMAVRDTRRFSAWPGPIRRWASTITRRSPTARSPPLPADAKRSRCSAGSRTCTIRA